MFFRHFTKNLYQNDNFPTYYLKRKWNPNQEKQLCLKWFSKITYGLRVIPFGKKIIWKNRFPNIFQNSNSNESWCLSHFFGVNELKMIRIEIILNFSNRLSAHIWLILIWFYVTKLRSNTWSLPFSNRVTMQCNKWSSNDCFKYYKINVFFAVVKDLLIQQ